MFTNMRCCYAVFSLSFFLLRHARHCVRQKTSQVFLGLLGGTIIVPSSERPFSKIGGFYTKSRLVCFLVGQIVGQSGLTLESKGPPRHF